VFFIGTSNDISTSTVRVQSSRQLQPRLD